MKKLLLFTLITMLFSCSNHNDSQPVSEISKLPPATQTGANKIGCLLDGKAFLPGNYNNSTNCFYQFVDGEYYFVVAFDNKDSNFNLYGLTLGTQKKQIFQGQTYDLYEHIDGNASAIYTYNTLNSYTSQTQTGKLTITKLDTVNHIVSGIFWYNIQDTYGVVHHITEGRFDFQYTN